AGTTLVPSGRTSEEEGVTAFFNIGTTTATFHQQWSTGAGSPSGTTDMSGTTGQLPAGSAGVEIANRFNFPIPQTTLISRPFLTNTNYEGRAPDNYHNQTYLGVGATLGVIPTASVSATYYDHQYGAGYTGSGMVTLKETISGTDTGISFVTVNGLDKTGESGSAFIGKWSLLTLVETFLKGGLDTSALRVRELPRVFISPFAASDLIKPTNLDVTWSMGWKRWDNLTYTTDAGYTGFTEDTTTSHVLMYQPDGALNWTYVADGTAVPSNMMGVKPAGAKIVQASVSPSTASLSYTWDVSSLPEGSYIIRVETFRDNYSLHYSFHQRKIFIKR
ncbi:MAG TPA: hypothetical protein VFG11_11675, partial [Acidobacteriota bacterium]|nr:hypothetical protein [Acidobacteriota bacterium]